MEIIGLLLTSLLSYVIPKKKNYWICTSFLHRGRFNGDPKYLFQYIQTHPQELPEAIKVVYAVKDKKTENYLKHLGLPVVRNSLNWLFAILRAEIIIVDGIRYGLGIGNFKFIQLWHGVGYKNIVLLNQKNVSSNLKQFFLKQFLKKIVLITATSKAEKARRQKAFNNSNVVITGSPRVDAFQKQTLKKSTEKIILYTPTYRDANRAIHVFTEKEWQELNNLMERQNRLFYVKKHPRDQDLVVPTHFSHIKDVTQTTTDLQGLLTQAEVLITDYSSIATDFVCLKRPIIFFMYDYEEYIQNNRTFYYDLKETLPGPFAYNYADLIVQLTDPNWFKSEKYQEKYHIFKKRFHQIDDGKSSQRILKEILKTQDA